MKTISTLFLKGLLIVLPLWLTVYIVVWIVKVSENLLSAMFGTLFPATWYMPGMGIVIGVLIIFFVGVLVQFWGVRKLHEWGENLIKKFPFIGDVYTSLKELMGYFTHGEDFSVQQVVLVTYGHYHLLGLVTRENLDNAPEGLRQKNLIAVYLPMSYQIGGYTVYVEKDLVSPVKMNKKQALKFALTGGMMKS